VRLDSGNLVELSRQVRGILDAAGHHDARIMATGDLNEYKILELVAAGAPIDAFGVGTELATSTDAPSHGAVYKLVELVSAGEKRYTAKYSQEKVTLPGAKQVFRYAHHDVLGCVQETFIADCEALLRPVILGGKLVEPPSSAADAREHARRCLDRLPVKYRSVFETDPPYPVEISPTLSDLAERVRGSRQ
jgi:nicotinate phosphoribosyltransferase